MFDPIVYEHPLNERIRQFLRLERLFLRIEHHAQLNADWDTQACVRSLLELSELSSRGDLKNEVMKELERHHTALKPLSEDPEVNNERLNSLLNRQQSLMEGLYDSDGQITKNLRNDQLLNAVQQRACIPGGGCDFDLPVYYRWLKKPQAERDQQIQEWLTPLSHVREGISLCLEVLRLSADSQQQVAEQGFYDQLIDNNRPMQLLRIIMAPNLNCYPEISGGKQRFTIRFSQMHSTYERPTQTKDDIEFSLVSCGI